MQSGVESEYFCVVLQLNASFCSVVAPGVHPSGSAAVGGNRLALRSGVIRAIYRSDSLVLTMELASCLDDKLLTIGDDSALSDLLPAVLALNEAVHSCAVSLVLAVCE